MCHTGAGLRRFLNHFLYGLATSFSRFKRCESLTPLAKEPAAARSPWKLLLEKSLSHESRSRTRFPTNETAVNVCQLSSTSHDTSRYVGNEKRYLYTVLLKTRGKNGKFCKCFAPFVQVRIFFEHVLSNFPREKGGKGKNFYFSFSSEFLFFFYYNFRGNRKLFQWQFKLLTWFSFYKRKSVFGEYYWKIIGSKVYIYLLVVLVKTMFL